MGINLSKEKPSFTAEAHCPRFSPTGPTTKVSMMCRGITMFRTLMNHKTLYKNLNETNEDQYYRNVDIAQKVRNDYFTALDWEPKKRYIEERRAACEKVISPLVTPRKSPNGKTTEQPNMTRQWTKNGTKFFLRWITDENTDTADENTDIEDEVTHQRTNAIYSAYNMNNENQIESCNIL